MESPSISPNGELIQKDESIPPDSSNLADAEQVSDWKPQKNEYMVMYSISIISMMIALDATILVPVLPSLAEELGGTATDTFWAGTSYLLTCAVFQPPIASLSDIFGRQALLLLSLVFFTAGSLIACLAHDFTVLLVGRSVQGVGGGGIITLGLIIFTDIIPLRHRPKWTGMVQSAWALGTVLGPLIGGLCTQHSTWRWVFYINFPFCGFGFVVVPLVVRLRMKRTSLREKLLRVDWVGSILFITSTTSFLIAISWAGVEFAWNSFQTLVPLILGVIGVVLTILWERWGAKKPFLRQSLFYTTSAVAAYVCAIAQGLLLYADLYYLPFYLSSVKQRSPVLTGLGLFPITCALLPGSVVVGIVITRIGRFRWAVWAGWVVTTIAAGLLTLLDVDTSTVTWAAIFVVVGLGHGLLLNSLNFTVQANAQIHDVAFAAAMYAFLRSTGMAVGVTIGGTVFQNMMQQELANEHIPIDIAKNAEAYIAILTTLPATSALKQGVLRAYVRGFQGVFEVMTVISGLGLLSSLLIASRTMDEAIDSEHVLENGDNEKAPKLGHTTMAPVEIRRIELDLNSIRQIRFDNLFDEF